jgi:hypothetical protein
LGSERSCTSVLGERSVMELSFVGEMSSYRILWREQDSVEFSNTI